MIDLLDSETKYYIIGLFQGDGHLSYPKGKGRFSIELAMRDKDIIYKIQDRLKEYCNTPIRSRFRNTNFKENYESICLAIHKQEVLKFLCNYIPTGKKSQLITPPNDMNRNNKFHYIRGLTDADGSVGITKTGKPFWSLCTASENIKDFFVNDIYREVGSEIRINRTKQRLFSINLYLEESILYLDNIYNNSTIYLDRKYNKYLLAKQWKRTRPKSKVKKKIWLPYEDKIILSDVLSWKEKMELLKRTEGSVKQRYWRLKKVTI